ncbi:hypothetical protein GCM10007886_54830 [Methylobacterium gregans]|nr:hypothetical protein GCM10007886_54830 [Methylobacterium gregans]
MLKEGNHTLSGKLKLEPVQYCVAAARFVQSRKEFHFMRRKTTSGCMGWGIPNASELPHLAGAQIALTRIHVSASRSDPLLPFGGRPQPPRTTLPLDASRELRMMPGRAQ